MSIKYSNSLGGGAGELCLYEAELLAVDPSDHALDDAVIVTLEEETLSSMPSRSLSFHHYLKKVTHCSLEYPGFLTGG